MVKKRILTGVMALAVVTTSYTSAWAYVPIGQDYHIPAGKIETDNFWNKEIKEYNLQQSEFLERVIQAPLIKHNPQKLKKAHAKYDDGLKGVYINLVGDSRDSDVGGSNHGGGYISLTKGAILINSAPVYGSYNTTTTPKDYNIYAIGAIAADYAHECGHWYYDDTLNQGDWGQTQAQADKDAMAMEERADAFGIRLLENVPKFSVGADLIALDRQQKQLGWHESGLHPSTYNRWNATYNYIRSMSKNRVGYDDDKDTYNNANAATFYIRVKNKDEYWRITVPDQYEVEHFTNANYKTVLYNAADRAKYVMGQVAWAIKNNCWDKKHFVTYKAQDIFKDMPETPFEVYALCIEKNDNECKIIDWVVIPAEGDKVNFYTESQKNQIADYINSLYDSLDQ